MPRDLFRRQAANDSPLTASPDPKTPAFGTFAELLQSSEGNPEQDKNNLHPYVSTLGLSDLESCIALENATFPEHERVCEPHPKINRGSHNIYSQNIYVAELGIDYPQVIEANPMFARAQENRDSAAPSRKGVLIAHVIATQCSAQQVTDASIDVPSDRQSGAPTSDHRGHQDGGRTIAVHSVSVTPEYQGRGFGKTICRAYIQRMETAGIADRIALLAHGNLIDFYQKTGFENKGQSEVTFGGGGWNDMIYDFSEHRSGMQLAPY